MPPALVLVVLLLPLGYLARRSGRFPENAADVLNRFVVDVCVPATILRVIPSLRLRWELAVLVVVPWILAMVAFGTSRLLTRVLHLDRHTQAALFLCTGLGNTSFLGFPLCKAVLGESSLPLAAVYDQLGSFLLLSFLVPVVLARATGASLPGRSEFVRRVVLFPPFLGLLAGLVPLKHAAWFDQVLLEVGNALVPTAMFAVGLRLRITPPKHTRAFAAGLLIKLGLMPLAALLLTQGLGVPRELLQVAVLESGMPAMISAGAALMAGGVAVELTAALVGWGIVASLVSVPAWALLVR